MLFMDNIDLNQEQTTYKTHRDLQENILGCRRLLIPSGGVLRPITCFYYLILFVYKPNDNCEYASDKEDEELTSGAPRPEEGFEEI